VENSSSNPRATARLQGAYEGTIRTLVEHLPQQVFVKDRQSRYLFVNECYARDLGLPPEEAVGKDDYEFFSPDLAGKYQADDRRIMESGQSEELEEQYLQGGQRVWIQITKAPVRGPDGAVIGVFGIFRDISEKREAQIDLRRHADILAAVGFAAQGFLRTSNWRENIRELLSRLGQAAKVSRAVLFETRAMEGGETLVSLSAEWATPGLKCRMDDPTLQNYHTIAGGFERWASLLSVGEIVQGHVRDFLPAEKLQLGSFGILSIAAVPVFVAAHWWGFLAFEECDVERSWKPEELAALQAAANILGEAVQRAQNEESLQRVTAQLLQAQKLEAIGQLAGGIAHDFNNILAATLLNLNLLKRTLPPHADSDQLVAELETDIQRASGLTRQLLLFGRRSVMRMQPLDVSQVVENLLRMLRRLIGEHVQLQWHPPGPLPSISGDAGMLEQVLVNLVVNARDSMPNGGRISLETRIVDIQDTHDINRAGARLGRYLCLAVADTGCGMNANVLQHIFEPFFTTKEPGKGSGLGLATVYSIAQQHGGWITVDSTVDRGTHFQVFLPTLPDPAPQSPCAVHDPSLPGGTETILLVEDEPSLRRSISGFLRHIGYRIIEATDGPDALRLWSQHAPEIDLLYSDMIMPHGMNGLQLATKLRTSNPSLRILLSSGYCAELVDHLDLVGQGIGFVPKPCHPHDLAIHVRRCILGTPA
jgi:PAS domain S-box-containing protein